MCSFICTYTFTYSFIFLVPTTSLGGFCGELCGNIRKCLKKEVDGPTCFGSTEMTLTLDSRAFRHHSTLVPGSDPTYPNIGETLLLRMSSIKHMDNGKPVTATTDYLFDGAIWSADSATRRFPRENISGYLVSDGILLPPSLTRCTETRTKP